MKRLALALLLVPQSSNRLWWAELTLEGPAAPLTLGAGAAGATLVDTELFAGELLSRPIPVPLLSPLGEAGLTPATLPTPPAGLTWSRSQPALELSRRYRPFLNRTLPMPGPSRSRATPAALLLLGAAALVALSLRRRPLALAALSLAGAVGLFALTLREVPPHSTATLLEVDVPRALAAEVLVARGVLELERPEVWLEARPEDARLEFVYEPVARRLTARASDPPGATLRALRAAEVPAISPAANDWRDLAEVWTRNAGGGWSVHGPWPAGRELSAPRTQGVAGSAPGVAPSQGPPGWLASGLPPGRGILVGRIRDPEASFWVRITGWQP